MFGRRIRIFRLLDFDVKIDLSWIILAILITWSLSSGYFPFYYRNLAESTYWLMGAIGAIGLFVSIIIHELAHSVVARAQGLPMKGITLFIFGGVAEMGSEPNSAKAEFLMAVVGPLTSLVLAGFFYALYVFGQGRLPSPVGGVLGYLSLINILLAAFNLLPAFPLDGGRILRSALWVWKKNLRWATGVSSKIGAGFGIAFIILGVLNILRGNFIGGMWWFLIGMLLQGAAKGSYQEMLTRRALEGESIGRFMNKNPVSVRPDLTIESLVEDFFYKYHYKMFPVVTASENLIGCVSIKQVKEIPRADWKERQVEYIAERCSEKNSISPHADAVQAFSVMRRNGASRLMVVDEGKLVGIISLKDMLSFLALKVDLEED
ncbi:MAG: site-2 protease family protein [Deltaproteobacteria bacterium]|nr:site-2 protease family protein [Deltaproteobacteria bacterium]